MKRQKYIAKLYYQLEPGYVGHSIKYAHNSAVRETEAMAREYARKHGVELLGGKPSRDAHGYSRTWESADGQHRLLAHVSLPI